MGPFRFTPTQVVADRCEPRIAHQMAIYSLEIINEHFSQTGDLEADDNVNAWKQAIASAITIAADQVSHGNPFFGAVLTLAHGNKEIGRYIVSVGSSPLKE